MRKKIQESNAYKLLDPISQKIINKREIRTQIEDAVVQARTMGIEAWKTITPIMPKYQKIVEEII